MAVKTLKNTKFKLGDVVRFFGHVWTVDGFAQTDGKDAYEIIRPRDKGQNVMIVAVEEGDKEFERVEKK